MNKYNLLLKVLIICYGFQTNFAFSSIQNKIIANVEDQIISSFELKNKIKSLLFFSNQKLSQENINIAKQQAMRSLVDLKLKNGELKKFKMNSLKVDQEVNNYLRNQSTKYNTDINGLKEILKKNDINFKMYEKEIKTEFLWQKLIFDLYKTKIILNNNEIDIELESVIKNNKNVEEYKISEIEILSEKNLDNKKKIQDIKDQINKIGFENVAIKFSISSSALDGGNLGWISSKSLSNKIFNIVKDMKLGDVSEPLFGSNTIMFIKLVNKRSIKNSDINIDNLKKQIINSKKNELLNLFSNSHLSKIRNSALIEIKYEK